MQGLRALAVVAVVAEHVVGHPRGGFVGVDVFFVISGFLITGNLLTQLDAGADDPARRRTLLPFLIEFYRRRIRRLLPAALTVVGLTVLVARAVVPATRFHDVLRDAGFSAAFWANWHFAGIGTDYFAVDTPPSPLQHFWSLAVEEQFYVVWPVVMFALVAPAVLRRGGAVSRRRVVGVAATVLSAVSLVIAIRQSSTDPTAAYFSTLVRAWELGLGAMLAAVAPGLRPTRVMAWLLSVAGTVLIVVAYVITRDDIGFPAPGALLPCVGAVAVLAAGTGRHPVRNPLLTNGIAVWLGDLSYSIYLVHFPVLILLQARVVYRGALLTVTALLLTLGAAILLRTLVERPVLDSRWLLPDRDRPVRVRSRRRRAARRRVLATASGGLIVCLAAGIAYARVPSDEDRNADTYARIRSAQGTTTAPAPPPPTSELRTVAQLRALLDTALNATTYPVDLSPSMADVIAGPQARRPFTACAAPKLGPVDDCSWGDPDAGKLLYLTGDSTSMVWAQALATIVEQTPGWRMRFAGMAGCHFASEVYRTPNKDVEDNCGSHTRAVEREITSMRPDLLVVSGAYGRYAPVTGSSALTTTQYVRQQLTPLQAHRDDVGRTVLIEPPPGGTSPGDCYAPGASPTACVYRPPAQWQTIATALPRAAAAAKIDYLTAKQYFCGAGDFCPPFASGTPVMHDATHAAPDWIDLIRPLLAADMRRLGLR